MKGRKAVATVVLGLVVIGVVVQVALDKERKTLDAAARVGVTGSFVQLRDGITHYELSGPTALAQSTLPMLVFWGKEDRTVPFTLSDTLRAAFPRAEFHAIDSAAHLPHIEQAAVVDTLLLRFLRAL